MLSLRPLPTVAALLAALPLLGASPAAAGTLSPDLARLVEIGGGKPPIRTIVQSHGEPTQLLLDAVALLGGKIYARFGTVTGFAASLPLSSVPVLAGRADVEHISLDLPVLGSADLSTAAVGATAARAETGLSGAGIGVAVLDTGVAPHPDLVRPASRIVGWRDLVNGKNQPYDDSGHGTHVAGIIAGSGHAAAKQGRDVRGVAPGAAIIGVKVLNAQMMGYTSTVMQGLDFCLANRQRLNIRVANLSLGQPVRESYRKDPFCRAVEKVWRSGIVVVVSAGNAGRKDPRDPNSGVRHGTITSPGNTPLVLTVGATRTNYTADASDDEMATYSSRGPTRIDHVLKPDLVAPGNRVLSLGSTGMLAASQPTVHLGGAPYMQLSGTSMAAPMVAGAVALMLEADPGLSPDTVKVRLMHSAVKRWNPTAPEVSPFARGAGLLNVARALRHPSQATRFAFSPVVRREAAEGQFTLVGGDALWGDTERFGNQALWSDRALWADCAQHGDDGAHILWGEPSLWADETLWADCAQHDDGAHILWGEPAPHGD